MDTGLTESAIRVDALRVVRGGNVVLPELSCDVARGSVTGLLGPSGSGKTTLIRAVVGANDVVNPDARNNQGSPIYGMPILNVDDAQAVVVLKRSMNPGFAGIENPLFYNPKTVMLFGDAKASIDQLIHDVKEV